MQILNAPLNKVADADMNPPALQAGMNVLKPLRSEPVYAVLLWNTRQPVEPTKDGVRLNFIVRHLSETSPGARINPQGGLDYTVTVAGWHNDGFVRVDHLEDDKGEQMGMPSRELYRSARFAKWCDEQFTKERIQQLARELRSFGGSLNGGMSAHLPGGIVSRVMDLLSAPSLEAQAVRRKKLEAIEAGWGGFVKRLSSALEGMDFTPEVSAIQRANEEVIKAYDEALQAKRALEAAEAEANALKAQLAKFQDEAVKKPAKGKPEEVANG